MLPAQPNVEHTRRTLGAASVRHASTGTADHALQGSRPLHAGWTVPLAVSLWLGVVLASGVLGAAAAAAAQPAPTADWEATGLTGPVGRLFAPADGALLATTQDWLLASADGGLSFRPVPLPALASSVVRLLAVDPT